jgi:hypothetical protein
MWFKLAVEGCATAESFMCWVVTAGTRVRCQPNACIIVRGTETLAQIFLRNCIMTNVMHKFLNLFIYLLLTYMFRAERKPETCKSEVNR